MDENNQPIDYHKTFVETVVVVDECVMYVYNCLLEIGGPSKRVREWDEEKKLYEDSGDANLEILAGVYDMMTEASGQLWEMNLDEDEYDKAQDKHWELPLNEEGSDEAPQCAPAIQPEEPSYRDNIAIAAVILFENIELMFEQLVQLAFAGFMADLPLENEYFYQFSIFEDSGDPVIEVLLDIVRQTREAFISIINLNVLTVEELIQAHPHYGRLDTERLELYFKDGHF